MGKELLFSLTRKDFKVETMRGSGPGGQKKNVTDSAVRITHEPSGAVAKSCDQRSQKANLTTAFKRLVETKKFKNWLRIEIARKTGVLDAIHKEVDCQMAEKNLKTEVKDDSGKWVEVKDFNG